MLTLTHLAKDAVVSFGARYRGDLGWWMAEAAFVSGWSLMWATALGIVGFVPPSICLLLMLLGVVLPGVLGRRDQGGAEHNRAPEREHRGRAPAIAQRLEPEERPAPRLAGALAQKGEAAADCDTDGQAAAHIITATSSLSASRTARSTG